MICKLGRRKTKKILYRDIIYSYVFNSFVTPYLQNWGLTVAAKYISNVKVLPQKKAEVTCQLKEGAEVTIIENANYYYKVIFIDENGIQREGFVAKRNLEIVEKAETEEVEELAEE